MDKVAFTIPKWVFYVSLVIIGVILALSINSLFNPMSTPGFKKKIKEIEKKNDSLAKVNIVILKNVDEIEKKNKIIEDELIDIRKSKDSLTLEFNKFKKMKPKDFTNYNSDDLVKFYQQYFNK